MVDYLTPDEQVLLAAYLTDGLGNKTLHRLDTFLQQANLSWSQLPTFSDKTWVETKLSPASVAVLKNCITNDISNNTASTHKHHNWRVVTKLNPKYPQAWLGLSDQPLVIFTLGDDRLLNQSAVAVVGTRQITTYGQWVTQQLTAELIDHHQVIVSGFMTGVDITAHQTAQQLGGRSIGVLGYGFLHRSPVAADDWWQPFLDAGNLLISQFPPHTQPSKYNYPLRNKLVAGLSQAVVVTEAAAKSGSRLTAQAGWKYDRVVCAVPGPIDNPFSEGCKELINQGARLVTSGAEVMQLVQDRSSKSFQKSVNNSSLFTAGSQELFHERALITAGSSIYAALCNSKNGLTLEEICRSTNSNLQQVLIVLSGFELSRVVEQSGLIWRVQK